MGGIETAISGNIGFFPETNSEFGIIGQKKEFSKEK